MIPTNSAAQTIVRLQNINVGIDAQLEYYTSVRQENLDTIAELEAIATWDDTVPAE